VPRVVAVAVFVVFPLLAASLGLTRDASAQIIADQYIVVFNDKVPRANPVAHDLARRHSLQVLQVYEHVFRGFAATIPAASLNSVERDPRVRLVTEDRVVSAFQQGIPTGVDRINAEYKTNTGVGVHVAILDTGIDLAHPDLQRNIAGGTSCTGAPSAQDSSGHGTHVAGIVAAANDGNGVVGVAPEARLWAVQVLNILGAGSTSTLICGVDFVDSKSPARGGPITVANMSLGGAGSDDGECGALNNDPLHMAICQAVLHGVTFVAAAGNSAANLNGFVPAAYREVLAVTALADADGKPCGQGAETSASFDDGFASFSNFATGADLSHVIAAPGVDVYSTYRYGGFATSSGTSVASAHVAGVAALYIADHPGASPAEVSEALIRMGEPPNVDFRGECQGVRVSHNNSLLRHPEPVVRADDL